MAGEPPLDVKSLYLTCAQSRAVDAIAMQEFGMLGLVLMENAGRGAAEAIYQFVQSREEVKGRPIVICCGRGNNGGDGFVIARHLSNWGLTPQVLLWTDAKELSGDAAANYAILEKMRVPIARLNETGWEETLAAVPRGKGIVVDALLGTGAKGTPRPPYDEAIAWINSLGAVVFAVDLPSGLDADSGEPSERTVKADVTLTFVSQKSGFASPSAKPYLGEVRVIDIGAPREAIEKAARK